MYFKYVEFRVFLIHSYYESLRPHLVKSLVLPDLCIHFNKNISIFNCKLIKITHLFSNIVTNPIFELNSKLERSSESSTTTKRRITESILLNTALWLSWRTMPSMMESGKLKISIRPVAFMNVIYEIPMKILEISMDSFTF